MDMVNDISTIEIENLVWINFKIMMRQMMLTRCSYYDRYFTALPGAYQSFISAAGHPGLAPAELSPNAYNNNMPPLSHNNISPGAMAAAASSPYGRSMVLLFFMFDVLS